MIWTAIVIAPSLEKAEQHLFMGSHDSSVAMEQARQELKNKVVVALVPGNHESGTVVPKQAISITYTNSFGSA